VVVEFFFVQLPSILSSLIALIEEHKAGSPTDPSLFWIHLKPKELALKFFEKHKIKISHGMIKRQLLAMNYKFRKLSKQLPTGFCKDREKQFQIIFNLVAIMSLDTPVISIDCKKKERIGNLYREGKCYTQCPIKVFDHDYDYLKTGVVIPHGIYDMQHNQGYVTIGNSHETAEFIADNLLWWWDNFGIHQYPDTQNILILCDAGGANSYRHHCFKKQMLNLAQTIGKTLIICHYPPYSSKWNPIEHSLFAHIHNAMKGVVFTDYNIVKELIEKTTTTKGLKVFVRLLDKEYNIGSKTSKQDVDYLRIKTNPIVPNLSYTIVA
jgi:hypothetical protein